MELVRTISQGTSIPVIVLSADSQEAVMVAALDAGAEDYVTKPFSAAELLARVRVALRRTVPESESISIGSLTISETEMSASVGSASVKLTRTEFDLLQILSRADRFVATSELLNDVWGPAYRSETDYVRVYVRRLRSKLESLGLGDPIQSRPGLGYRLAMTKSPHS
jgi:two-component system KDP operon response regulator KdpE